MKSNLVDSCDLRGRSEEKGKYAAGHPPFSGCLMPSASDQKLFCGVCSVFKCTFDEFEVEKVVSPSYSSSILAPLPTPTLERAS